MTRPKTIQSLYKASPPYMLIPEKEGVGYYGVLMYDSLNDLVQCHICGAWVKQLTLHTWFQHKVRDLDYRNRYGFTKNIPLCNKGVSAQHKKQIDDNPQIYKALQGAAVVALARAKKARQTKKYRKSISSAFEKASYRNARNICEEQLKKRLHVVATQCGKPSPSFDDLMKYDPSLTALLRRRYGSYLKGKEALGFDRAFGPQMKPMQDEILIANLRKWVVDHGQLPISHSYPQYQTCVKHFGSWKRAKFIAGLYRFYKDQKAFELYKKMNPHMISEETNDQSTPDGNNVPPRRNP